MIFLVLPNSCNSCCSLMSDDTNIFASNHSFDALFHLTNKELSHVNDFFVLNNLSLNLKKLNRYCFAPKKPISSSTSTLCIKCGNSKGILNQVLGHLCRPISWSDHISNITYKINRNLWILSRIMYLLPHNIRRNL